MKRFRFRLARLERLRDLARREARGELIDRLARLRGRERARAAAEGGLREAWSTELPEEVCGDIEAWRELYAWREAHLRGLEIARFAEREARNEAEESAERHRRARRAHRVLERLRERRFRRWRDEAELEERKFLDEVHQLRTVRETATKED